MKTLDDIYAKLEELEKHIDSLKKIDYESKNLKNVGNVVVDNKNNPLKVYYSENAKTIQGKTYEKFKQEIIDYIEPLIEEIKKSLENQNKNKYLGSSFKKDWSDLLLDQTKDADIMRLATMNFIPSYVEIFVKLEQCADKNGGTEGIITKIPPVGASLDGLPFSIEDYNKLPDYSGWWYENGEIKAYFKKADFKQWLGKCGKMKYKVLAWR